MPVHAFLLGVDTVGRGGDAGLLGQDLGLNLVTQRSHVLGAWTYELDLAIMADIGEVGVFGQEPVSGMDRVDVRNFRGGDDPWNIQVAFR